MCKRSHNLGMLRASDIGKEVNLSGWVHRRRDHGGLIFIDLRDKFGLTQLVFDPEQEKEAHAAAHALRSEWVLHIKGVVRARSEGMANPNMITGEIEIEVKTLTILSQAKTPPFSICDDTIDVNEELRLKYRYLDMRRGTILNNLHLRHQAMLAARTHLDKHGFIEVSTPILARSTPEGARDYLVPSRIYPGNFYALPQSPQIFKQLLMIGGCDRYFQVAPCFRDEDLRSDRQPEFTQIDIELSFSSFEEVKSLMEGMISDMFKKCIDVDVPKTFNTMPYKDALEYYGTDRPDTRFDMRLTRIDTIAEKSDFTVFKEALASGGCIKGINVKGGASLSRREIDKLIEFVRPFGLLGLAWMKLKDGTLQSSVVKFFDEELQTQLIKTMSGSEGDLFLFAAASESTVNQGLDHLRRFLSRKLDLLSPDVYTFNWIVDFPLVEFDEEEKRYKSLHHPFTAPCEEDIQYLEKEPLKVRSIAYDLVINGFEVGGGSMRIHNSDVQDRIFSLLGLTPENVREKFGFFVDALSYGTPPHMGIAFGLDRLIMLLAKTENIRDVIAFPKTQKASDLMMQCPASVMDDQLQELEINVEQKEISWL